MIIICVVVIAVAVLVKFYPNKVPHVLYSTNIVIKYLTYAVLKKFWMHLSDTGARIS